MQGRYSIVSKEANLSSANKNLGISSEHLRHRRFSLSLTSTVNASVRGIIRPMAVT